MKRNLKGIDKAIDLAIEKYHQHMKRTNKIASGGDAHFKEGFKYGVAWVLEMLKRRDE